MRSHLEVLERGTNSTVAIVGAGYAGVELAIAVAERLGVAAGNVRLITPGPDIMPGADAGQRASAQRTLSNLGVTVMAGAQPLPRANLPARLRPQRQHMITVSCN